MVTGATAEMYAIRAKGVARDRDRELAGDGWRRRFVGSPPRLDEAVQLYYELGMDVRLEPLADKDLDDECAGCRVALALFRVVYTREKP